MIYAKGVGWERLGSQITDSNGRLTFQLSEASRLPVGLHRIQLVPIIGEPDEQAVELTLAIVPPNCNVVICSIDGSFAASLSLMGKVSFFVNTYLCLPTCIQTVLRSVLASPIYPTVVPLYTVVWINW